MLEFKKAEIFDLALISGYYKEFKEFSCENTVANIIIWQNSFGFEFCIFEDILFAKVMYGDRETFCLPVTKDMKRAIELLKVYTKEKNIPLCFFSPAGERFDLFKELYESEFDFEEKRNSFEYVYLSEKLSELSGKKYHGKRNHISSFMRNYDWSYEELSTTNAQEVRLMTQEWYSQNKDKEDRFMRMEQQGVNTVLSNLSSLDIKGGVLRVGGKIVAFTFGCQVNSEVFDVCYEKALNEYNGAYTMINNCFVKNTLSDYKYINREDDMGIEGLRKAKLSYHPEILLEKYLITIKEN